MLSEHEDGYHVSRKRRHYDTDAGVGRGAILETRETEVVVLSHAVGVIQKAVRWMLKSFGTTAIRHRYVRGQSSGRSFIGQETENHGS
jgi:hypothetical protein